MRKTGLSALALCALGLGQQALALQSELVGSGFSQPVFLTAPAGDPRLFVVERGGRVQMIANGVTSTFLDISARVDATGERGLLGLAFDPQYATNGRFFVNYIDNTTQDTVIASYTTLPSGLANPASGRTVLTIDQPAGSEIHKAGWIGFRPGAPGQLYVATGDAGPGDDPANRAQDLSLNLGKILRITPGADGGYSIPADNPFAGATPGNDEIWAYGLRNPYRASFDRVTGDFWIGDVGQDAREEIDFEAAGTAGGRNYGWRPLEGGADNPAVPDPAPPDATAPLFDFEHGVLGQSVIGGYVYRGTWEAGLDGSYLFGDFVSGRLFSLRRGETGEPDFSDITTALGTPFGRYELSSFGEDGVGNLYALGLDGNIFRIAMAVPEPAQGLLMLSAAGLMLGTALRRRRHGG